MSVPTREQIHAASPGTTLREIAYTLLAEVERLRSDAETESESIAQLRERVAGLETDLQEAIRRIPLGAITEEDKAWARQLTQLEKTGDATTYELHGVRVTISGCLEAVSRAGRDQELVYQFWRRFRELFEILSAWGVR